MLLVKDLYKRFEEKEVLKGISFQLFPGEIFAIMGESGGGKTTLMKCLSGVERPSSGEIWLGDTHLVENFASVAQKMGYVFQNAALFDSLTVEDNVLFGVRRKERLSRSREQEILSRYLEAVSLAGVEKFYPHQLSGGMQKRVGLARALAMEPEIIFYDEPTSGLDPSVAYSIDELIVRTRDSLGVTSIVVTHDLRSAARIADRVAFLEEGKISFLGSFEDLSKSPSETIQRLLQLTDSKKLKVS